MIISYYTKNTPYEAEINEKLRPSLEKFKLEYDIQGIEDLGSWQRNTGYKSYFIKEMLLKHKKPVVFLDADAIILEYPEVLFNIPEHIDIGYHHFNWYGHWRNDWNNTSRIELLSGTMYWAYNPKVLSLIDVWMDEILAKPNQWEQKTLEKLVESQKDKLNICDLPASYCCVLMQDNSVPNYIDKPVIIHTQASRRWKHREKWGR